MFLGANQLALFSSALRWLSPFQVKLFSVLGHVSQHRHLAGLDLHEAAANGKTGLFVSALHTQLTEGEGSYQGCMTRQDTKLPFDAGCNHHVYVLRIDLALGCHDL